MQIYLARNNVQAGPYTLDELNQMLSSGDVDLTDLMWHEGMANWQTVGEVTHNNRQYLPNVITRLPNPNSDTTQNAETANTAKDKDAGWLTKLPTTIIPTKATTGIDIAHAKKQIELASIGSRVVAKIIDFSLLMLASMPTYIALFHSGEFQTLMADALKNKATVNYTQLLNVINTLPSSATLITNILVFSLLFAQLFLLVRRGQSLGKMMMGIRILDIRSNALPSLTNLVLLRTFLPSFLYSLSVFGVFILLADFITMFTNKDKQSLHDKIANTYVVRADDTQTTPLTLEPSE